MARIKFYNGTWSGIPLDEDCYIVPRNPFEFDPQDSNGFSYLPGILDGSIQKLKYDSRPRVLTWVNLPAVSGYVQMIHTFESYVGEDFVYVNLGNELLPGLYSTGDDWYKIRVFDVNTDIKDGASTYYSGGTVYNRFDKIELKYELLGVAE